MENDEINFFMFRMMMENRRGMKISVIFLQIFSLQIGEKVEREKKGVKSKYNLNSNSNSTNKVIKIIIY